MEKYYLAIDIGASSGRHILCHMEAGKMVLEEVWRFDNGMKEKNGHLCWDIESLKENIILGMKQCAEIGKVPVSVGIDTWGVDFVLLDENDNVLGDAVGYRDGRTTGMDQLVYDVISLEKLYGRTGIQKQIFNTIYQLMAVKQENPEHMEKAVSMLMIPDYLNFVLTGNKAAEYTNATTTQLVNPETKDWDFELIEMLGYNKNIFEQIRMPGYVVGELLPQMQQRIGYNCQVVLPATHDTGSAVLSVPTNSDDAVYISSGTWSLMGIERMDADCSMASMKANFTNEGGYDYRFRYLKNIMGLWMIQSVRHELNDAYSFAKLCEMAAECTDFPSRVDVNDDCFLAPKNMTKAIQDYCAAKGGPVPETPGQLATVIYQSLADSYGDTVKEIEEISGRTYSKIHIVGGGSNADYLNQLTATATGKTVYAGPTEATAIGNLTAQMLKDGVFTSLGEARNCIFDSFGVKTFEP